MNEQKLKEKAELAIDLASRLIQRLDKQQRHGIATGYSEIIVPLTTAAVFLSKNNNIDYVRLVTETLFALGYLAGKEDSENLSELWK